MRSFGRHEALSVRMARAECSHHSAQKSGQPAPALNVQVEQLLRQVAALQHEVDSLKGAMASIATHRGPTGEVIAEVTAKGTAAQDAQ